MTMKPYFGTISHGTMRAEDLVPAFASALAEFDPTHSLVIEANALEENERTDWDSEEIAGLLDELFDALNEYAPPYGYFGAHPDDGADYGFWLHEGFEHDFDGLKVTDTSEVPPDYTGEVLHVSDHGNPTLYSAVNGELTEVWALV